MEILQTLLNEIIGFLDGKTYAYSTESERLLEKLKKTAKDEKYFDGAETEYSALVEKLSPNKENDLIKFKDELKILLENEIVSRYYYQDGRIIQSLKSDTQVQEAIDLLSNPLKYDEILAGTYSEKK